MRKSVFMLAFFWFLSGGAGAVELMKWERIPLQIPLTVGQERVIFVDKNVRVGFPDSLNGKLRIQSSSGTVYLDARAAFPSTRLVLKNVENGEMILLDVSASEGKTVREPVQLVYQGAVSSASSASKSTVSDTQEPRQNGEPEKTATKNKPVLNGPLPVVLTRYAAQTLYAPLRTVEPVAGIHALPLRLPSGLSALYPEAPLAMTPLAAWGLGDYSVVAVKVRNPGVTKVVLDPRNLSGRFIAATFQHRWLGEAGRPEDTTTLYLVVKGRPESAFPAEPASRKEVR
ncbi:TIGR03749 family integrating conjugative element protein [Salmonella enterica subsp. enterica serovar Bovismorbificans]|uniref:TIGR03749 family integrating conjugative element protein n=4 Tax=Salmonella enterica TaxID=28901 RepID=A0A3V2Y5H1_SALNE|nr:TIGR03749 family integrating conjugative element protein [Salmonella enterica]EAA7382854.1 TIGR03749 family integrating conjugative element protein [Salmonella enterica subsp. enterica]EBF8286513.1 TIGR03749 family integrating conjugative element protein [Salmonella enterica subsp. houtenae]EBW9774550.1 TIGR03749 family integrating conjugative element protein [Salmonella enterica subsp. enterica serovar Bovismorbificans]ECE0559498.1 TIGR03749 family integrating conjugative element protein [S